VRSLLHSRALIGTKLAEEPNGLSASAKMNEYKGKMMMRTWFLRVAIGTFAAVSLGPLLHMPNQRNQHRPERLQRRATALPSEMKIAGARRESSICIS
jgi:hypothetical protein